MSTQSYHNLMIQNTESNKLKSEYDLNRMTAENIEYKLWQDICYEIIERLNIENDIIVRNICLQMLGLLIIANDKLINYIKDSNIIKYIFWKQMDCNCCINNDLYNDIMYLLPHENVNINQKMEAKPSVCIKKLQQSLIIYY